MHSPQLRLAWHQNHASACSAVGVVVGRSATSAQTQQDRRGVGGWSPPPRCQNFSAPIEDNNWHEIDLIVGASHADPNGTGASEAFNDRSGQSIASAGT